MKKFKFRKTYDVLDSVHFWDLAELNDPETIHGELSGETDAGCTIVAKHWIYDCEKPHFEYDLQSEWGIHYNQLSTQRVLATEMIPSELLWDIYEKGIELSEIHLAMCISALGPWDKYTLSELYPRNVAAPAIDM